MKRFFLYVATLVAALSVGCSTAEKVVYLADFMTEESAKDAVPAVRAALEECAKVGADRLVLPGGELRLRPEMATEKYQWISNNDESLKRIAFDLVGVEGLEIDGNGTSLIFTGFISPFNLERCADITIKNLTINFTRTFHSEGTVRAKGKDYLDLEFPADYNVDFPNGVLRFRDSEWTTYQYSSLLEFDSVLREPAFRAYDYWLWNYGVLGEKLPNGLVRIHHPGLTATIGNVMVFGARARYNPAFTLYKVDGFTLEDVTIYHTGGMGVIAQLSHDILLERVKVTPPEGRMISATADATHFVNCGGYLKMIDCLFENQKDDATNIHGLYMSIDKILGPDKVLLGWHNSGQYGVDFIEEGTTLEIVDNKTMMTIDTRTVKSIKKLNKLYNEVTFTEPLPEGVELKNVVAADDYYPEVLLKGCRMRGNRARGILLGSRGNMTIEDNYFHIAGAAILLEGDGNYWYEQSGTRDLLIKNNIFENGNFGSRTWGSACISVGSGIPERENSRYHQNVRVEGNTFRVFDPRILNLYCVDGVSFTSDNVIEMTTPAEYKYLDSEKRYFVFENCDNVTVDHPMAEAVWAEK